MYNYSRTTLHLCAFFLLSFFLLAVTAEQSWGAAPESTDPCASEWQGKVDEHGLELEWCDDNFSFGNYDFSFRLPQKRIGYPYPIRGMAHGVVFPLGPLRKEEENRELLLWGAYNLRENNQGDIMPLADQIADNLKSEEADHPGILQRVVHSQRMSGATQFLCYAYDYNQLFTLHCQGVKEDIIYYVTLSSTEQHKEEDIKYFDAVFTTLTLHDS